MQIRKYFKKQHALGVLREETKYNYVMHISRMFAHLFIYLTYPNEEPL